MGIFATPATILLDTHTDIRTHTLGAEHVEQLLSFADWRKYCTKIVHSYSFSDSSIINRGRRREEKNRA